MKLSMCGASFMCDFAMQLWPDIGCFIWLVLKFNWCGVSALVKTLPAWFVFRRMPFNCLLLIHGHPEF